MPGGLAAWALGLGGAGQVAGRLCYRPLVARLGARGRVTAVIGAGAAATLLLGLVPGRPCCSSPSRSPRARYAGYSP